ncbi:MAG TPA: RsmG family class I SAM-dependent methyltransferase [Acidimicrobiales bacterium]|nr:RsmG family class I SAM-dependent methyltransferase [Acidimicrobiales bacterium]
MNGHRDVLVPVLEEARGLGFLGPGPVESHLDHAAGYAVALESTGAGWSPGRAADLGSGAGLPGLPLALHFLHAEWTLVEASVRRAAFLRSAIRDLGLNHRVEVVEERAEVVGRMPAYRGSFDLVVARSFGPPAVLAECAAPLLRVGGLAAVSEPPGGKPERWSAPGLAELGMAAGTSVHAAGAAYQVLVQVTPCPPRFPRRVGIPAKRPLFSSPGKKQP